MQKHLASCKQLLHNSYIETKHTKDYKMKTITTRTNEKFTFLTIVFESREEAEKNCDEGMGECVYRAIKALDGENGFVVKVANDYKEFIRLVA